MSQFDSLNSLFGTYGRFQRVRGGIGGLPGWARAVVFVTALPGILLLALSILLIVVSILALLLLAAPTYGLLRRLTAGDEAAAGPSDLAGPVAIDPDGSRHPVDKWVDAKVVKPDDPADE